LTNGFIDRRYWETQMAVKNLRGGKPWSECGVHSSGCGSVHRAPAIGALFWSDRAKLRVAAEQQSVITHQSRLASAASCLIAELTAAVLCGEAGPNVEALPLSIPENDEGLGQELGILPALCRLDPEAALTLILSRFANHGGTDQLPDHVVPVLLWILYCVMTANWNYAEAVSRASHCGGECIAPVAIVGALCGAARGIQDIPSELMACVSNRGIVKFDEWRVRCDQCYELVVSQNVSHRN
jgi:ADP-ribosylglycohydrolase